MPEEIKTEGAETLGSGTVRTAANDEIEQVREWLRVHGARSVVLFLALAIVLGASVMYRSRQKAMVDEAAFQLGMARQVQDLETVAAQYSSTPSAPLAVLTLAKTYYDNGDFDRALNKYLEFTQNYPKNELLPAALLGQYHCMEARLQFREALAGFEEFPKKYPDHFLRKFATFGKARCLEQLGQREDARVVYENFIASEKEGDWIPRAEEALADLKRSQISAKKPLPVFDPTTIAPTSAPSLLDLKPVR